MTHKAFEQWVSAPPYERDIARWPLDEARYAWPGQYRDIAVQLAWDAWQEALRIGIASPPQARDN